MIQALFYCFPKMWEKKEHFKTCGKIEENHIIIHHFPRLFKNFLKKCLGLYYQSKEERYE